MFFFKNDFNEIDFPSQLILIKLLKHGKKIFRCKADYYAQRSEFPIFNFPLLLDSSLSLCHIELMGNVSGHGLSDFFFVSQCDIQRVFLMQIADDLFETGKNAPETLHAGVSRFDPNGRTNLQAFLNLIREILRETDHHS